MALVVLAASYSYCYSDTTYGVTNNAAGNGLSWGMENVIPDATPPYVTVQINGLTYRYTMTKDPNEDVKVYVRNEDPINGGYVFEEVDDWSQLPGGNIRKYFRFPYIDSTKWGDGSIDVEGNGTVSNAIVTYNFKMDVDDILIKCETTPLADPTCPGYANALADYLKNLKTEPDINDPFYNEWVQAQLNQEVTLEEEEPETEEESEEEEDLEKELGSKNSIDAMVDAKQQESLLAALASVATFESYYQAEIKGGEYIDTLVLKDAEISDNKRALRNLASDQKHKTMVRSQYDRE